MDMTGSSIVPVCIHDESLGSCSISRRPSGRGSVQRFGDQQVDIVIMQLQRSEAGGIVAHIKRRAQRIVILRNLAERGHFALAAARHGFGLQFCGIGVNVPVRGRRQNVRQLRLAHHIDQEDDQDSVKSPPVISSTSRVRRQRRRS